jgi:hypothetical protein
MAPPGMKKKKPALVIKVGVGKPKDGEMPPPMPKSADDGEGEDPSEEDGAGGKVSREKALVIDENHRCDNCQNYDATSGDCSKVEGYFDPGSACLRYFEPMEGSGDEEAGESPDDEAAEGEANAQ